MTILSCQTLNGLSGVTVPTEVLNDPGEEVKGVDWGTGLSLVLPINSFLKIKI